MLARLEFAHLPTLLEPLERLSEVLDGPKLWVKRDDQTGLAFGGNKTRKLEFLLADAQAQGARTLITRGAAQSNHCRQTAAAAARFGFDCTLVLTDAGISSKVAKHAEASPQLRTDKFESKDLSGNRLLDHLFGAKIVWATANDCESILTSTFNISRDKGEHPYLIPYGGSNELGASAYAYALKEMLDQCSGLSQFSSPPSWIVFPTSSGGTQAGLVLGAEMFGYAGRILGISVDENRNALSKRVSDLATAAADLNGLSTKFESENILVNDHYVGDGYGVISMVEREAIYLFARMEGILLDPVYTGRAAAGMIDLIHKGFFKKEETILFWHTGGTPALFADQYREFLTSYDSAK